MDKKQLYTTLSCTRKFELIHLNFKKQNRYVTKVQLVLELTISKFNSLYKNGKIYKIMFDDGRVYVVLTSEDLNIRLKWHLSNKTSQVCKKGKNNPKIEPIVTALSADKKSLENVELLHQ